MSETARVIEVFPSIQGEGIYAGKRHLFVRFGDCNLNCCYCDTDFKGPSVAVDAEKLLEMVHRHLQSNGPFHAVSLTGGEPLIWWRFLQGWLPKLKAIHPTTYLETNGTLPDAFQGVLAWIDIIAMDLKLPSSTGERPFWTEHECFLRAAHSASRCQVARNSIGDNRLQAESVPGTVFVKLTVTADTRDEDLRRACDLVAAVDARIPVVLQPVTPPPVFDPKGRFSKRNPPLAGKPGGGVTPWRAVSGVPSDDQISRWQHQAEERVAGVQVIPQLQRALGVP